MNRRSTIHWSTHPQREQNDTKKYNYGMGWLQNGMQYGPAKLDNRLSQNVQVYRGNHEEKDYLRWNSRQVYSKEMRFRHYYL